MIGRIWHRWTKPENADAHERLLKDEVFPGIAGKNVPGYRGIQLFRRAIDSGEVEFVTIMRFDSWEALRRFSGENHERAGLRAPEGAGGAGEVRRAFPALRDQGTPRLLETGATRERARC